MRRCWLMLVLVGTALPVFAAKRVTVEQLEQALTADHGKPDALIARHLSDLELTERLNDAKLAQWEADLPGAQARQALLLLADAASFLDLPQAEILQMPPPDFAAQRQMIALTVTYVSQTLKRLPDFSATRLTSHFEDTPQGYTSAAAFVAALPLQFVAQSSARVLYRDGGEVVDTAAMKGKNPEAPQGLTTTGEFGAILVTMLVDAAHGKLAWSHWEQGTAGPVAVFRYAVPKEQSHYEVSYCCVAQPGASSVEPYPFHQVAGYNGEFAIDPANGTVKRVTLKADLRSSDPIVVADMLVDYGPVEIGGKTYVCPVKSISISRAVAQVSQNVLAGRGRMPQSTILYAPGHLQTRLNHVAFEQYHLFRAETRLLADFGSEPGAPAGNDAPSGESAAVMKSSASSAPSDVSALPPDTAAPLSSPVTELPTSSAAAAPPAVESASPAGGATIAAAPAAAAQGFSPAFLGPAGATDVPVFKANSEAVVVDVVVTKGNDQPIVNLRKEDFQLVEDGQAQRVDLFEEHTASTAPADPLPPMPANVFTNQPVVPPGDSVNVLLLDSLNTPKPDQAFVHQQILNFLKNIQPGTRVAIFALGSKLRYIQGFTDDPAVLRAALNDTKLMKPESSPASRTRQDDVDDADHIKTMEMMNGGHMTAGIEAVQQAHADFAGYQGGEAVQMTLAALRRLALYLAGVPGRKNLIWFSSTFPVTIFPSAKEKNLSTAQRTYGQQIKDTADVLTSSKVAIYPVGAEGTMINRTIDTDASLGGPVKGTMEDYIDANSSRAGTIAAMEQLASDTGGEAIFNTNDLNKAIARVVQNGSHYYTLVYSPTNRNMDGKYRRVEVKVNGGRYKAAYRHGYYGDQAAIRKAASEPEDDGDADPLRPLLGYGLPSASQLLYGVRVLPASPQPDATAERAGGNAALTGHVTRYTIDFMIRWTDVDLDVTSKGTHAGKIQVGAIAYDRDGKPLNWIGTKQLMNLNTETYAAVQRSGIPASLQLDLPAEAVSLQTGIYDWGSRRVGTLQVPLAGTSRSVTASPGAN